MKKFIEKVKQFGLFETIVLLIYIVTVFIVVFNHECWEDEAQSWLIARDLNPIQIISQMKYEGHSPLWYYILYPFAKIGFKIEIQKYISFAFTIATVVLILKKSPFNKFLKVLLTFSSGMIFFYSAMARPYCMIPFLLACIACIYKGKESHPYLYALLLGLLANTHLVMVPAAGILMLEFWGEKLIIKRKEQSKENMCKLVKSLLIVLAFFAVYGIIVLLTLKNSLIVSNFDQTGEINGITSVSSLVKRTITDSVIQFYGENNVPVFFYVLISIVMALCIIGSKNNIKQAVCFWSQFLFTFIVHTFFWIITPTRVMIIIYMLMFWAWVYKEDGQYKKKPKENKWILSALVILIIISAPGTYKTAFKDIIRPWTAGKITAEYIKENIPENSCFICSRMESQQSVVAYLPKNKYKFYMPNTCDYATFNTWNEEWNNTVKKEDIIKAIRVLQNEYDNLYILGINGLVNVSEYDITLLLDTRDKWIDSVYARSEQFYVYEVK